MLVMPVYGMEFSLQHPEDIKEQQTLVFLKALRASHDLQKWKFTYQVHIDKTAIPHSHSILTLRTRHGSKDQKDMLLSTYLHQQIHWLADENIGNTNKAKAMLKQAIPEIPVGFPKGARDEYFTYLHLIVCPLCQTTCRAHNLIN